MSTIRKFAVMKLYIKYSTSRTSCQYEACSSLKKALFRLFGDGYDIYSMPACISVPFGSDFIEIDAALTEEFNKYPALKGMRYQLQVCRDMLEV